MLSSDPISLKSCYWFEIVYAPVTQESDYRTILNQQGGQDFSHPSCDLREVDMYFSGAIESDPSATGA